MQKEYFIYVRPLFEQLVSKYDNKGRKIKWPHSTTISRNVIFLFTFPLFCFWIYSTTIDV